MVCVIFHLYYIHLLDEIYSYLKNIRGECDFYITIPKNCPSEVEEIIRSKIPNSFIKRVENRGEDIGAFIDILQDIDVNKYQYFFKVHTKKDTKWRHELLRAILLHSDQTINRLSRFKMVGSSKWKLKTIGHNSHFYNYWCEKFGYSNQHFVNHKYRRVNETLRIIPDFVGGSIFACTKDIIQEIKLRNISQSEFEEGYQSDQRKEHAFERFFGKIVYEKRGQIAFV